MINGLLSITLLAVQAFALDKDQYGHHGRPARYEGASEGIIHPWDDLMEVKEGIVHAWERLLKEKRLNKDLKNKIEMAPKPIILLDSEEDIFGMMDPIPMSIEIEFGFGEQKKKEEEEEDDLALLAILKSTPDMCPLCHQEGHGLGHEDHKKFLSKLRKDGMKTEKMEKEKSIMITCEMCRAEGHVLNHEKHLKENQKEFDSIRLFIDEAAIEFAWEQEGFGLESKKKLQEKSLFDDLFGKKKEKLPKEKLEFNMRGMRDFVEQPEMIDFLVNAEIWDPLPLMAAARRADPVRNFHLDLEDDEEGEEEEEKSLWYRLLDNLRDLFGSSSSDDIYDFGRQFAVLLLVFVGLFLTTLGLYELFTVLFGESGDKNDYELVKDEEIMLQIEAGRKGAIVI